VTATVRARLGRQTLVISPDSGGETAAELAAACGLDRLTIDGRAVPAACPLVVSGLVDGSELSDTPSAEGGPAGHAAVGSAWEAVVVTGPDSGARIALPAGRHVVGRSPTATIPIADDRLEPHHALLAIDQAAPIEAEAAPRVLQLAGRTAIEIARHADATVLRLGATRLDVRRTDAERATHAVADLQGGSAGSPWHRDHHRPIRSPAPDLAPVIELPEPVADASSSAVPAAILPALLGACAAAAMAVLMHQPLILLFGLSAVVVAAGTWAAQHASRIRRSRRARTASAEQLRAFATAVDAQAAAHARWLRNGAPDVDVALDRIALRAAVLWERRPEHLDAWDVVLGRGERTWRARLATEPDGGRPDLDAILTNRAVLTDVPITVALSPGAVLGLAGRGAAAVARSAVIQLAANCGPADWELLIVTDHPRQWAWANWLPHDTTVLAPSAATADTVAAAGRARHLLVVVDAAGALASRTSPLRRLIAAEPRPAVIAIAATADRLPSFCTSVLTGHDHGAARWFEDAASAGLPVPLEPAGITVERATDAAARLAHRRDPEVDGAGGAIPRHVDVLTLIGEPVATAASIAAGWDRVGYDPPPAATIGEAADGRIEIDLCRDGPHTLIGGTTGAGKSELLRSMVVSLAVASPPELLSFVLVDYKGGAAFDACASLPHVAGLVTDLDDRLAARALRSLDAELHRRERLFRDVGASDLADYRTLTGGREPLARLVVVVDEFATLAADLPGFLSSLVGIAQRGRSLGVHLVLATQRPGAAINDDIRANTNLRIALRVQDPAEALDVVGDRAPAAFARTAPGRAMLRLGTDERVTFQVATTGGPTPPTRRPGLRVAFDGHPQPGADPSDAPTQLETLVARIRDAAADRGAAPPVWQPVLPTVVTADDLIAVAPPPEKPSLGILDDPGGQRRLPLRWDHRHGHLIIAGSLGSGTTTAAITTVRGLAARYRPEELHVYVIDGRGGEPLAALGALPHCGGVIKVADGERLERLIRVLHARTRTRPEGAPDVILVVDGLPAARGAVDALGGDLHERFDDVVADGPAAGVTAIATTDQPVLPLALTARSSQRWIMRLADPAGAAMLDLPAGDALPADAPPGRLVALPERCEGQLAAPDVSQTWTPRRGDGPDPIGVLPPRIAARELRAGTKRNGRTVLPIGLEATFLQPVEIELAAGDHVLVLGTSRSGRSTALVRLATAWHGAHRDAPVVVMTPRRSPLSTIAADHGWRAIGPGGAAVGEPPGERALLVVDDAELTDHPNLPAWCASPAATVLAASRPDALRGAYGHWTQAVRRARTGLVLGRTTEMDGDQLGVVLPRRWPVPHAAGRGWLIVEGACQGIVQVAADAPPADSGLSPRTGCRGASPTA
jgi:S-DNA-T family DNA segregation ATPase FtsK/SpoIIIE